MKKSIANILFIAFIVRFILLLLHNFVFTLPQGEGDANSFERNAYLLSISDYQIDVVYYLSHGSKLYELLISFIYVIFGHYPLILGLFMILLGVYLVHLVYKAALYLWNDYKIAHKAAWVTALFPLLMVESALTLREVPIMVFMMLGLISFIKFWKYKQHSKIFGFILFTFIAVLFHSGMLFLFIGFIFFINFNARGNNFFTRVFSILLVVGVLYFMNQTGIGTSKIGGSFDKSMEMLKTREQYETKGGSRYPSWTRLTGGSSDLLKVPVRYITFFFAPLMPWLVRSVWHSIGLIDAFLYLFMFYYVFKYRRIYKYNDTAKAILFMFLFTALVFSLGGTNVGTAIRHRAKLAPMLILLAAGMNKKELFFYQKQNMGYIKYLKQK